MNIHEIRYQKFIKSRKDRTIPKDSIIEKHHIIPKSLGGDNSKENLIKLTAKEHFIAHLILWKAYGGKMAQAFFMMNQRNTTSGKYEGKLTSRQYSRLREDHSIYRKKFQHKEESKKKTSASMIGVSKSQSHRENIAKARKGTHTSDEVKKILSESHKGKKLSPESIAKRTETRRKNGIKKQYNRKPYSPEEKALIGQKISESNKKRWAKIKQTSSQ
jgi:hypothetical protein